MSLPLEAHAALEAFQAVGSWEQRARMIRGLVALLLARVNGLSADELQAVDLPDWFNQLGLSRQLSPSRSNGLNAVLQRMRDLTRTWK